MTQKSAVGFAVLYQWEVKPGKVRQFVSAWADLSESLRAERGALGSRLHRSEHGTWMAYAQWPTRAAYERVGSLDAVNQDARERMLDAIEDTWPPVFLTPHDDRLDPID
ncbi:antibiotic biosynthesis monooxygenase family protein [Nevskia sp.]|mgnify:CR=1 FL=1|jgi:quinol monooxygenase YgiN|uniref:antibiotic biosynthesis monooxygenase family protein n=1 Tax=Nevskia sp. TaxID=1929292 RepID=UPI0025E74B92|nr:antibiotic biosynthesis monooxygenase family protein [Nevskia sp.]